MIFLNISNITEIIMQTINTLLGNLFSSIDNNIYTVLDDITFIDTDILSTSDFLSIFGDSVSNGFLLIANAFLIGFLIYYSIRLILANFGITQIESPYQFILKLILLGIFMNSSFFICEQIINIVSLLTSSIRALGEDLFNTSICFSNLIQKINNVISIENSNINIFSIEGILKSFLSFGFFNLIISYSIRYIMLKVFVLISPFAILSFSVQPNFFKSWIRCFISLLFVQVLVSIVLLLLFSIDFNSSNDLFSKFIFVGAIYSLMKANSYVKEFIGGINTEIAQDFQSIKNNFST